MITSHSSRPMIIMDGGESPLDVLSRAATMLQENQNDVISTEDTLKQTVKQLPTTKWKKERRLRAEYSRKSDPKIPDEFTHQFSMEAQEALNSARDIPLDMSVRQRGDPPSYAQTISNLGYKLNYRSPAVAPTTTLQRDDVPSGISMCDPIIDEHFRRSLGKDYGKVFSNNNVQLPKEAPGMKAVPNVIMEMMDGTGLSVDEHFAKALGDTWLQLNKKGEINNEANDKSALMSV